MYTNWYSTEPHGSYNISPGIQSVLLDNVAQSAQEGHNKPGTSLFSTIDLMVRVLSPKTQ